MTIHGMELTSFLGSLENERLKKINLWQHKDKD